MKPNLKNLLVAGVLVASTATITATVVSQDAPPDPDAMMAAWMELAKPGPQHEKLARTAGLWESTSSHWMYPGAEPDISTTRAKIEPIMGGRFVVQHVKGKMHFGADLHDFEGIGIYGYDNGMKKYTFTWFDNFGTMMMHGIGEEARSGDIVYFSEMPDPTTGATIKMKSVAKYVNADRNIYEMHIDMGDGNWFKNMEIVSERTKGEWGHDDGDENHEHDHDTHDGHDHDHANHDGHDH